MANLLTITEFKQYAVDGSGGAVPAPRVPALAEQSLTIGGASVQSDAFHDGALSIMVHTDTACCLAFGADPLAVNRVHAMGAGETRFYGIQPGTKLAVIAST